MGFQNKAGSIIIDATLTDVGRRYMAQGKMEITKFSLGDDEIDYGIGVIDGEYSISSVPPTLEAPVESTAAITHGLVDYGRNDLLLLPFYRVNNKIPGAISRLNDVYYLSVNEETTKKISSAIDISKYVMEADKEIENYLLFECGIDYAEETGTGAIVSVPGRRFFRDRFIYNVDLYDPYCFIYADSRFFDSILSTPIEDAYIYQNQSGAAQHNYRPLRRVVKTSLPSPVPNYDTYYCISVKNDIYDESSFADSERNTADVSMFKGPRSIVLPINFDVNQKMRSKSNGAVDVRYTKFGKTSQNLFSDGNKYDYVDTSVMIEGTASARTKTVTVRIIRFSGT